MKLQLINPLIDPDWDRQILLHPGHSFFHSSAWAGVLAGTYGYRPAYLRCVESNGSTAIVPIMEVHNLFGRARAVSLPFTDECSILAPDRFPTEELLKELIEHGRERKWNYLELRGQLKVKAASPFQQFYSHSLDLTTGETNLWKNLKPEVRTAIRKAKGHNLRAEISNSLEAICIYYSLHCSTRKKHGVPPQSFAFFRKIFECVIARDLGCVVIAWLDQKPIAGAVFFHFGKRVIYKFGASDPRAMQFRGNNLVMWTAIRSYAEMGSELLHFGRTSLTDQGLRRFKLGWGTREGTIQYFRFDLRANHFALERSRIGVLPKRLFSVLPVPVLRLIGKLVYPHCA